MGAGTPDILLFEDGLSFIAWAANNEPVYTSDVFGRFFSAGGRPETPSIVLSVPEASVDSNDQNVDVVELSGGNFLVVWTNFGNDGDAEGVYAGIFERDSPTSVRPIAGGFRINTTTHGYQSMASAARHDDGGFVVSWIDSGDAGVGERFLLARRFSAEGEALTGEILIPVNGSMARPTLPEIASRGAEGFVVTWTAQNTEGGRNAIVARRLTGDAAPVDSEIDVSADIAGSHFFSDVVTDERGNFVVVWSGKTNASDSYAIFGRRFLTDGSPSGDAFLIAPPGLGDNLAPDAALAEDGSLVVVWTDISNETEHGVFARVVSSEGEDTLSELVKVNTRETEVQSHSIVGDSTNVAVGPDHSFSVVWDFIDESGRESGVFARTFCYFLDQPMTCGDFACPSASSEDRLNVSDALAVLRAGIGLDSCEPCVCDANGSGTLSASDALVVLRAAVRLPVALNCPVCTVGHTLEGQKRPSP